MQKEFFVYETTTHGSVLLVYLVPLFFGAIALGMERQPNRSPHRVYQLACTAAILALLVAFVATIVIWTYGPLTTPLLGINELGFAIRLDALSVIMFGLVALIGLVVVHFSRNYLDGDPRQASFFGDLCLTIGAVILFVLSGNLVQLVVAWIGTSLALHRLLRFYDNRPAALLAARKKFIVARIGDVCFATAAILFIHAFGTGDLGALTASAKDALNVGVIRADIRIATLLVVIAAALKSAMFPFHGWLLEVMETPTPVSALLHAGLLNAGTFLIVRLGELIFLYPPAVYLLITIGGFTALFASTAMVTQSSVKVSLAYSSAAHMGFMLMLCGFGAHSVAIMHLVAHSFYKAHAFLSSGSVVEYAQATAKEEYKERPQPVFLLLCLVAATAIFIGIGSLLGIHLTKHPGEIALGIIFVTATTALLAKPFLGRLQVPLITRTLLATVGVTFAFFALEITAAWLLTGAVAAFPTPNFGTLIMMAIAVILFALVTFLYTLLPLFAHTSIGRALYVHLKHGFYANTLFDRLIGGLR